jgi:4-hydroxybenzoate polyprenyltransferase
MQTLRAYLQLVRLPAVFTAMADIFLGFLLRHSSLEPALDFGMVLLASSCLYLAGMVFNDVFDREIDAQERPERPIPSGRISWFAATRLGLFLMMAGIGAANVAGRQSLYITLGIAAGVFAYDVILKKTPLGPLAMGCCRLLNVMLGASAGEEFGLFLWSPPQLMVAAWLGVYIVGVTWFARQEASTSSRWQLVCATVVANLGLAGLLFLLLRYPWFGEPDRKVLAVVFGVIALTINRRLFRAISVPSPENVQPAVRTMLLSIITLDAVVILAKSGTENPQFAMMTLLLLIPAMFLGRWIYVT